MRKLTFALLALLPLLFSCEKENAETFEAPEFASYACQLIPKTSSPAAAPTKAGAGVASDGSLLSIELTESGLYVLAHLFSGEDNPRYTSGRYTVNGSSAVTVYTLNGFGTLEFDNSRPGEVSLTIKRTGGIAQTIMATLKKATGTNKMFRSWKVDKTRVTVKGWTTASADFTGCNFHEIAEFLRKNHHKAPADVPVGYGLETITFTGTNSVIFTYTDNTLDMSEFSLSGDAISYSWNNNTMGFTFLTQEAKVDYLDGKCLLKVDADIQNSTTSGSVTFVLSPAE